MSRLSRRRQKAEEDIDIDMVPIMNMFLVLIPFLLMSASFLNMKAINTSIPLLGSSSSSVSKKEDIKVTVIAELRQDAIHISASSDALRDAEIGDYDTVISKGAQGEFLYAKMVAHLQQIKAKYPASDTLILVPQSEVLYETIIKTMDMARYAQNEVSLFPNVVLSGKVG